MSSIHAEVRSPAFFELYSSGRASADDIDDFVGRWHDDKEAWANDMSLPAYLGLSEEEYDVWVCDPFSLPHILAARRSGRRLAEMMAARFEEMRRANHPSDSTILFALGNWLKAHRGH